MEPRALFADSPNREVYKRLVPGATEARKRTLTLKAPWILPPISMRERESRTMHRPQKNICPRDVHDLVKILVSIALVVAQLKPSVIFETTVHDAATLFLMELA